VSLLFSECLELQDVTFKNCKRIYDMNIISTKLHHLKIIDCVYKVVSPCKIDIDALNLSSLEYSGHRTVMFSVTAPNLKVFCNSYSPVPRLHQIDNLVMLTSHSQVRYSKLMLVIFFITEYVFFSTYI
jgi:hypothetical protein